MPGRLPNKTIVAIALPLVLLSVALGLSIRSVPRRAIGLLDSPLRGDRVRGPGLCLVIPGLESLEVVDPYTRSGELAYRTVEGSRIGLELGFRLRLTEDGARRLLAEEDAGPPRQRLAIALDRRIVDRLRSVSPSSLPETDARAQAALADLLADYGTVEGGVELSLGGDGAVAASIDAARERQRIRELVRATGVRILLVGVDGMDWQIAEPLIERGELPNVASLRQRGAWGEVQSLLPMLSPLLWTSVATGVTPDKHGVVDFLETDGSTGLQRPVTARSRKVRALWDTFSELGRSVDVVAWWASWPAEEVAGHLVSDRVAYSLFDVAAPDGDHRLTWPASYYDEIRGRLVNDEEIGYREISRFVDVTREEFEAARRRIAVDRDAAYREPVNHLTRVLASTESYHRITLELVGRKQADFAAVYYQFL
ncbi:MAG TPA: alkaline phosphatase family protein, partial [Candidatus Polarisedimenticolaceae bacterium]|nr:alkaline phosphatase family protein [Candidatus Polarisedimenticolaceae bacterium]